MSDIVVGIIAGSIVSLISFALGLFGNIWYSSYQENRQRHNEALKQHFADLKEQYIVPTRAFLSNLSNQFGRLLYFNTDEQYSIDAAKTSWPTNDSDQNFECFKAHFASTADKLLKLEKEVNISNEKNQAFNNEISALLMEKTCTSDSDEFKDIIKYMRLAYVEKMRREVTTKDAGELMFNFHEVVYSPNPLNKNALIVRLKDGRHLATVNSANEAEKFKKALIEVAEDIELVRRGQTLYRDAETLESGARSLSQQFYLTCEQYGKFGKRLKKKKNCLTCKLIFEE